MFIEHRSDFAQRCFLEAVVFPQRRRPVGAIQLEDGFATRLEHVNVRGAVVVRVHGDAVPIFS